DAGRAGRGAPEARRPPGRGRVGLRGAGAPRAPAGASAAQLDSALLAAEQDLGSSRREVADVEAEAAKRTERRRLLPELLAAARERQRAQAQAPLPAGDDPRLAEAQKRLAQARQ